ncbi:MAG: hypothetical protein CMN29_19430 [Sandaracinus sp.]|nr:hypothetical protein [Sandaracinus sp.]
MLRAVTDIDAIPFVDPETHEPVVKADEPTLAKLREAVAAGQARRPDGEPVPAEFDGAYLTEDGRRAYLVLEGIPNFLVEERLELSPAVAPSAEAAS